MTRRSARLTPVTRAERIGKAGIPASALEEPSVHAAGSSRGQS